MQVCAQRPDGGVFVKSLVWGKGGVGGGIEVGGSGVVWSPRFEIFDEALDGDEEPEACKKM